MDPEVIYQLIHKNDYDGVISLLRKKPKAVVLDPGIEWAISTMVGQLIHHLEQQENQAYYDHLVSLFHSHNAKTYQIGEDQFKRIILVLIRRAPTLELAAHYAKAERDLPECREVLDKYHEELKRSFAEEFAKAPAPASGIQIKSTVPTADVDHRRNVFRSKQEANFYRAARSYFQNAIIYPNASLNSVLNFDTLKPALSEAERTYFFTALVDFVVLHAEKPGVYLPIYFFELDSSFHDTEKAQEKDLLKDNILKAAGQTLHRIRKLSRVKDEVEEFEAIIMNLDKKKDSEPPAV